MKLFYKPGACSLASHIVLRELGADFELEKVDTGKGLTETGRDFRTLSPNGYVPALQLESGEAITENPALLQYLGDLKPELGLTPPAGTMGRVRLQELLNFLSSELHKAFGRYFSGRDLTAEERQDADGRVTKRLAYLEGLLADGRPYLLGETFSVADAYGFVIFNWTGFVGFSLAPFEHIPAYMERIGQRPAVVAALKAEGLA